MGEITLIEITNNEDPIKAYLNAWRYLIQTEETGLIESIGELE